MIKPAPLLLPLLLLPSGMLSASEPKTYDVIVYGGTSGGIAASVQVARMGKSVLLISPDERLGGLTTGGLGQTDIGNQAAIGGISREFYERIAKHYQQEEAWKWQKRDSYRSGGQSRTNQEEKAMWTFEPHVALKVYQEMLKEAKVPVLLGAKLNRKSGVKKQDNRILSVTTLDGREHFGKTFIDATYEGDLMAAAGVSYTVGREANATYKETLNGVQTKQAIKHQLVAGVDPYVKRGDPKSGLLPGIDPTGPGEEGSKDHRVQAYCFRMCMTDHPENRIPFQKPKDYDPLLYELLLRNFEAGASHVPLSIGHMPNRKTDTNNNRGVSTDFIGQNYDYPEADYATRAKIVARHLNYQKGLMWTLANHPRVPERIRKEVARWGMCKDEFQDNDGWPTQIYVREARRMIGSAVMTQHHCQGRALAEDAVGMAAYTMDSHNVQRHVDAKGHARNEGDVQVGGFPPYPISYRSIVPEEEECSNLLVPVCLSASHIAFGSIRMEPVFMVLGQSAATAACMAVDESTNVQKVSYEKLRGRLLEDKQVLGWKGKRPVVIRGIDPKTLKGIVLDDGDAQLKGFELTSNSVASFLGTGYRHDDNADQGKQSAIFTPKILETGTYEVRLAYSPHANRATNVPVTILHAEGATTVIVNQRKKPPLGNLFFSLGKYGFEKGGKASIRVTNEEADGYVIVDAVQLIRVE